MNFKVGDWVRYFKADSAIYQVITTNLPYGKIQLLRNRSKYLVEEKFLKHWQPKEGEWCWFWNECDTHYDIKKFSHRIECTNYITTDGEGYSFCEPFIGELPTFLKENK